MNLNKSNNKEINNYIKEKKDELILLGTKKLKQILNELSNTSYIIKKNIGIYLIKTKNNKKEKNITEIIDKLNSKKSVNISNINNIENIKFIGSILKSDDFAIINILNNKRENTLKQEEDFNNFSIN